MTPISESSTGVIFVAIDVAKQVHEVLIESPTGRRQRWRRVNCQRDFDMLRQRLQAFQAPVRIGFEATGTYHRPLAYFLHQCGFELRLISSLAVARTRDALYNSWDKNDPKDTQVLLHLLKTGVTQRYHDPLVHAVNDLQEFAQTHYQISLRKVRVQHSIMTHYLPLYFPEADRYYTNSRAQWFTRLLHRFPCPAAITRYSPEAFAQEAWTVVGRKVNKHGFLQDLYGTASQSVGHPVSEDSEAIQMFRVILTEHQQLCATRAAIEQQADQSLHGHPDYQRLRTLPGIGPILALTILAEAGDLRRFAHHRQFLTCCGFDLSTQQWGQFRQRIGSPNTAMPAYAMPSGWRPRARCGCGKIRFDKNMPAISRVIRRIRIARARRCAPEPPKWHVSHMASSRPGPTIVRTLRRPHPVEHSVRSGRRGSH